MVFSSILFLLYFLPLFFIVYFFIGKKLKNYWILLGSIVFYSWGAPKFVFVILVSTIIDFYLVKVLHQSKEKKRRKILLFCSITLNLGLLVFFKYSNFMVENFNFFLGRFGLENLNWTRVALPIGISFYTFQTLTYSIDIYRGHHKPLDKLTDYLLYIMSFPQMIAGPIVRFSSIAEQLVNRVNSVDDKLIGFYRFTIGLSKKVLIANVMGQQADLIMNGNIELASTPTLWVGIIAYTFQIYFDFSGYSDMAIGLGRMMGFRFPENFNSPYISKNISEFWRRWHITLGDFMRDYLYIPLGGNRVDTKLRLYFNLGLVFLLSGLWHGASWNFVLWGAFHGCFLILDRLFLIKLLQKLGTVFSVFFTFFITMLGWVVFRLESFQEAKIFYKGLFSFNTMEIPEFIPSFIAIGLIAAMLSFINLTKVGLKLERFFFLKEDYSVRMHITLIGLSIIFFILCISSIITSGFNPFIYFRF